MLTNPARRGRKLPDSRRARRRVGVQPKCPRRRSPPSTRSANDKKVSRYQRAKLARSQRPPPRPSPRRRPARRPRRRCRRARRSRRRRRSLYTTCRPRRRRRRRSDHRPRLLHRARRPRSPRRRRPPPPRVKEETPKEKLSRKERKTRGRGEEGRRRGARQKTTREAREARERRYRREIDDARRSLVEQKEMWLVVKDSEQQCRDLELEVAEVRRDEAALSAHPRGRGAATTAPRAVEVWIGRASR